MDFVKLVWKLLRDRNITATPSTMYTLKLFDVHLYLHNIQNTCDWIGYATVMPAVIVIKYELNNDQQVVLHLFHIHFSQWKYT